MSEYDRIVGIYRRAHPIRWIFDSVYRQRVHEIADEKAREAERQRHRYYNLRTNTA